MTIDTIRERAEAFDRRGWRQDAASMAAFALIVVANAIAIGFETSVVEKLGDGLSIAASMYVLRYYWRVREANPAALGETASIDHYRREVLRRQAMGRNFWPRMALLFGPGIILSVAPGLVGPQPLSRYVMLAVAFALWVAGIEWANRREARRLAADLESVER
jgi:hypothetical protein